MTTTLDTPRKTTKREHERVAEFLSLIESKASALAEELAALWDENGRATALMDEDEIKPWSDAMNRLHDLESAAGALAHQRRMDAMRANWTAQDWAEWDLVRRNID